MKFNKLTKFFMVLSLVAFVFAEIGARRPGLYTSGLPTDLPIAGIAVKPEITTRGTTLGDIQAEQARARYGRGNFSTKRKATVCRRNGCNAVKVTGSLAPNKTAAKAIVCKGFVCRRAIATRSGASNARTTGFGGRRSGGRRTNARRR